VQLGIDKAEVVVTAEGLNEDGRRLLEKADWHGLTLDAAMDRIIDEAERLEYIEKYLSAGSGNIVITTVIVQEDGGLQEEQLMKKVETAVETKLAAAHPGKEKDIQVEAIAAPKELREVARNNGISSGKMAIQLLAEEQGYKVTDEELHDMTIYDIAESFGGVGKLLQNEMQCGKEHLKELVDAVVEKMKQEQEAAKAAAKEEKAREKEQAKQENKNNKGSNKDKAA